MERPCAWKKYTPQQIEELEELCRDYKQFLSENKTERLCVKTGIKMAEEAGYVDLETVIAAGRELKAGDKVYAANHGKDLMLVNLGTAPLEQGFNILGAHVDSPRLDLKQNPAFEAGDIVPRKPQRNARRLPSWQGRFLPLLTVGRHPPQRVSHQQARKHTVPDDKLS